MECYNSPPSKKKKNSFSKFLYKIVADIELSLLPLNPMLPSPYRDVTRVLSLMALACSTTASRLGPGYLSAPHRMINLAILALLAQVGHEIHLIYIFSAWTRGKHHVAWPNLEEEPIDRL